MIHVYTCVRGVNACHTTSHVLSGDAKKHIFILIFIKSVEVQRCRDEGSEPFEVQLHLSETTKLKANRCHTQRVVTSN